MSKRSLPSLPIRAMIRLIKLLGHTYVRLPFAAPRRCNMCGYEGPFRHSGMYYIRPDALCMSCWSTDRERLFALYVQNGHWTPEGRDILHFAPEPKLIEMYRPQAARYVTADLFTGRADVAWNVEQINCEDQHFDAVMCSHVLEHVDTTKSLAEIFRVLRPGGKAFLMIPIYEGLDETYFDPDVPEGKRHLHYHQPDHVRLIGRDFQDQVRAAGFALEEYRASHEDIIRHGLQVGEKVFVATRPA